MPSEISQSDKYYMVPLMRYLHESEAYQWLPGAGERRVWEVLVNRYRASAWKDQNFGDGW